MPTFLGNPTLKTYDVNLSGGGAIVQNRLWVNGTDPPLGRRTS